MNKPKIFELIKPGVWKGVNVTKDFVKQIYNATKTRKYDNDRGPYVKGHPKHDDPAVGWWNPNQITLDGDRLQLQMSDEDLHPDMVKELQEGKYGPLSIALRPEDLSIRHIGFQGAIPPAITDLTRPDYAAAFSEKEKEEYIVLKFSEPKVTEGSDAVRIEFGEFEISQWQQRAIQKLFRQLKNWFIDERGQEAAETIMPEDLLADIAEPFRVWEKPTTSFSERTKIYPQKNIGASMTEKEINELKEKAIKADQLEAENQRLKSTLQFSEYQSRVEEAKKFFESEGKNKLEPALEKQVVHLFAELDGEDNYLEFSEGNKTYTVKPVQVIKAIITKLNSLDFSEETAVNGKSEKPSEAAYEEGKAIAAELDS